MNAKKGATPTMSMTPKIPGRVNREPARVADTTALCRSQRLTDNAQGDCRASLADEATLRRATRMLPQKGCVFGPIGKPNESDLKRKNLCYEGHAKQEASAIIARALRQHRRQLKGLKLLKTVVQSQNQLRFRFSCEIWDHECSPQSLASRVAIRVRFSATSPALIRQGLHPAGPAR